MDRDWLEAELAAGRSIESLARESGQDPSTVGYWVRKHGLTSRHAERHAARGGIDRETLAALVGRGLTQQALAEHLGVGASTVRHWLRKHRLETARARQVVDLSAGQTTAVRRCLRHGETDFVVGSGGRLRCRRCRSEHVSRRRRRLKEILIEEAGGACRLCGYDRSPAALHFHHLDRATKSFSLSNEGVARSLAAARREAVKCVLLCANCHAEVEAGIASIPP